MVSPGLFLPLYQIVNDLSLAERDRPAIHGDRSGQLQERLAEEEPAIKESTVSTLPAKGASERPS